MKNNQFLQDIVSTNIDPVKLMKMTPDFNVYYEPFFGDGALFFVLAPKKALVNVLDKGLINLYRQLQRDPDGIIGMLDILQYEYNSLPDMDAKESYYYGKRDAFEQGLQEKNYSATLAALFLFLNKTCSKGICQKDSKDLFHAPFGRKEKVNCYDNLEEAAEILEDTLIRLEDFRKICTYPRERDFVFLNPPYHDPFLEYQKNGFSDEDQRELAAIFADLTEKGVHCMLITSNTDFIKDLYKDYHIEVVSVKRPMDQDSNKGMGEEVIITNYDPTKIGGSL